MPVERNPPAKAMMERFAPKTAALETPNVEGEAIELFRLVCMMRPERARPAPAMMAASTRGMRMFQMIRIFAALPFFASAAKHSDRLICDEPTKRQTKASRITAAVRMMMTAVCFFLIFPRTDISLIFSGSKAKAIDGCNRKLAFEPG